MKRLGIHSRLVIAAVMILCLTVVILGFIGVKVFQDFALQRFHGRMDFLGRYLAMNSELGILIDERDMLEALAENLISEQDVAAVKIISHRSGVLADKSKEIRGPLYDIEKPVRIKATQEYNRLFSIRETSEENREIGFVRIAYSTAGINQSLKDLQQLFLW